MRFAPKLLASLRGYDRASARADVFAGITVGLVALPLAMAFAISSGVPPAAGLYCAIVAGFLISALGGSRTQIGGPTGAFVVVVSGIVARHGIDGLYMCTMMAGVMLLLLGLTGLGRAVDYIPRPVIVGFTNGIAVLIAGTQIKDFLGLQIDHVSGVFLPRLAQIAGSASTAAPAAVLLGAGTLAVIVLWNRRFPRVPGTVVAVIAGTAVAWLARLPVETVGSRFGAIPSGLPAIAVPQFRVDLLHPLLGPAVTVALLGAIESLMSASVADRMTGDRHDPNQELLAQGMANVVAPLFGGLPATGAIARTATSVRSGARTPVAGMIHAVTLFIILLVAAPLAAHVPLAVLAAVLLVVAWHMGDWEEIPQLLKLSKTDISVWAVTLTLTVFADLTVAVQAGMILAALLFIRKVAATTQVIEETPEESAEALRHQVPEGRMPAGVTLFRVQGPLLFGTTEQVETIENRLDHLPATVILGLRGMTALDATGLEALEHLAARLQRSGRALIVCGAREQPARLMTQSDFAAHVGRSHVCVTLTEALDRARAFAAAGAEARP